MTPLSDRIMPYLRLYRRTYGQAPTVTEIARAFAEDKRRVRDALQDLQKRGLIRLTGGERGIEIVE